MNAQYTQKFYQLNDHDETCGFYPHLKKQLELHEKNKIKDEFEFLINYTYPPSYSVWSFLKLNKSSNKRGLIYYNAYDGLHELSTYTCSSSFIDNFNKFHSISDTLCSINFQIGKQLRRMETQIKNGDPCSYCQKTLDAKLYPMDIISSNKDLEFLKNMEFPEFLIIIKKIDFLIGNVSMRPVTATARFLAAHH